MDEALLTTFVEFYNKGDHAQNGCKPHVYTTAVKNVRDKCGVDITKDNIISRRKTFDKHYSIISKMLATSGFGWDWTRNKISVDSDVVWDDYINVKKTTGSRVGIFTEKVEVVVIASHKVMYGTHGLNGMGTCGTREDNVKGKDERINLNTNGPKPAVGGDNPDDSGGREGPYRSKGRLRLEDQKPYTGGARASDRGDRRPSEAPRRAGGVLGEESDWPGAGGQASMEGGSEGKPSVEKTQSRSYRDKIMIVCAVSGGLCSA
ncbi:hypothetical protein GUJ93_ZPchr0013g34313 [Zizania palustris]|uniref:Myb/SANT-like domain-containing protein n=1 Tax=Zizania palustris TaxID=103762 RepID=A0A8J5WYP1_ZIZPA|nr:hypothetical protein GUJ93_ZPchr0013g34313 [Zizania palustris]